MPSQRLGQTAADVLDEVVDELEFAANAHGKHAEHYEKLGLRNPTEVEYAFRRMAELAKAQALKSFAETYQERARLIRVHDEAITKRTFIPRAPSWWRRWFGRG